MKKVVRLESSKIEDEDCSKTIQDEESSKTKEDEEGSESKGNGKSKGGSKSSEINKLIFYHLKTRHCVI